MFRRAWLAIAAVTLLASCASKVVGIVEPADGGMRLITPVGKEVRLVLLEDARSIRYLDGHMVEVRGPKLGKTLKVRDWKVREGLHGLAVWVGPLEARGVQVGVHDRNSGGFYLLDDEAARDLEIYAGHPAVLEGYIEGPHRLHVVYYRVLGDPERLPQVP